MINLGNTDLLQGTSGQYIQVNVTVTRVDGTGVKIRKLPHKIRRQFFADLKTARAYMRTDSSHPVLQHMVQGTA